MSNDISTAPLAFGLRDPDPNLPSLSLRRILRAAPTLTAQPPAVEPRFDSTVDYIKPIDNWSALGNNTIGNCNAVAWANQRRLVTATLGKKENYPDFNQVIKFYKTQNPRFDPKGPGGPDGTTGPGSPADEGMVLQLGLNELRRNGGPDGVKPVAFAKVDVNNLAEVRKAVSIFGSVWVGFAFYQSTEDQWRRRVPWTRPPPDSPRKGGHAVIVGGYLPDLKCVTWGETTTFDDSYWGEGGAVFEAWVVIWPEHLGTRNFMTGVDLRQLAAQMKELTKGGLILPAAPFSSLYFVKTRNQGSGKTEVHVADPKSNYALRELSIATGFGGNEGQNGVFAVYDGDLYFVKLRNTGSGKVEVHRATAATQFSQQGMDIHTATGFGLADADNGIWNIDGGDLYFIKTRNTGTGRVEVHRVNHLRWTNPPDIHQATAIPISQAADGAWNVWGGDLYFIKYRNTPNGKVEVHQFDGNHSYQEKTVTQTWFDAADGTNGVWEIGAKGDLYFTKTKNTGTGRAEVHIATAQSEYQNVSHYATYIGQEDGPNGTWCIG